MSKPKFIHSTFLYLVALAAGAGLFLMGWNMGQNQHKKKAVEAVKAGITHEASLALSEWYAKDPKAVDTLEYRVSCAAFHAKNGNLEAVKYNLTKALELMGK